MNTQTSFIFMAHKTFKANQLLETVYLHFDLEKRNYGNFKSFSRINAWEYNIDLISNLNLIVIFQNCVHRLILNIFGYDRCFMQDKWLDINFLWLMIVTQASCLLPYLEKSLKCIMR